MYGSLGAVSSLKGLWLTDRRRGRRPPLVRSARCEPSWWAGPARADPTSFVACCPAGDEVTIFHRGTHELPGLDDVEHVHGDPHFRESIDDALGAREFDVVIAQYGRVQFLAEALAGRCERFVSVGGVPVYRGYFPVGGAPTLPIPVTEEHAVVRDDDGDPALRFSRRLADAEAAVFTHHPRAHRAPLPDAVRAEQPAPARMVDRAPGARRATAHDPPRRWVPGAQPVRGAQRRGVRARGGRRSRRRGRAGLQLRRPHELVTPAVGGDGGRRCWAPSSRWSRSPVMWPSMRPRRSCHWATRRRRTAS